MNAKTSHLFNKSLPLVVACLGPHFMRRAEDLMGKSPPTFSSPLPGMTGSLWLNAAKEALHKEFFHSL